MPRRGERADGATGRRPGGHRCSEDGASLVEFAVIAPFVILLIFGGVDFGWALSQSHDLRATANQGARLATVNSGTGADPSARLTSLVQQIQARVTQGSAFELQVAVALEDTNASGVAGDVGDDVVVCVRQTLRTLSGLSDVFLPDALESKAIMRMEQDAEFAAGSSTSPAWAGGTCSS